MIKSKESNDVISGSSFIILLLINVFLIYRVFDRRLIFVSLFCTFLIPTILLGYSYYFHFNTDNESGKKSKSLNLLKLEYNIISTIPVLLFGLGVIYTQYTKYDFTSHTIVFLLLSVIFGSIFPWLLRLMQLKPIYVMEEIIFSLLSISFGFLLASMAIPLYMKIYKLKI